MREPYSDMPCDETLDAQGLRCPMPLLKAKKALAQLSSGQRLGVLATDPGAVNDFTRYSQLTGHTLEVVQQQDDVFYFVMVKK